MRLRQWRVTIDNHRLRSQTISTIGHYEWPISMMLEHTNFEFGQWFGGFTGGHGFEQREAKYKCVAIQLNPIR